MREGRERKTTLKREWKKEREKETVVGEKIEMIEGKGAKEKKEEGILKKWEKERKEGQLYGKNKKIKWKKG